MKELLKHLIDENYRPVFNNTCNTIIWVNGYNSFNFFSDEGVFYEHLNHSVDDDKDITNQKTINIRYCKTFDQAIGILKALEF